MPDVTVAVHVLSIPEYPLVGFNHSRLALKAAVVHLSLVRHPEFSLY